MKKLMLAAVLTLALSACASQAGRMDWWTLGPKSFEQATPGVSKADVERLVGKPIVITAFDRVGEEVWDYRYADGSVVMIAEIHFNRDGKVKYYTQYPDPARYSSHTN
jgi:outer membrane protein assembly factor BamE (lipoprotein component of BamABCDE complex)